MYSPDNMEMDGSLYSSEMSGSWRVFFFALMGYIDVLFICANGKETAPG